MVAGLIRRPFTGQAPRPTDSDSASSASRAWLVCQCRLRPSVSGIATNPEEGAVRSKFPPPAG